MWLLVVFLLLKLVILSHTKGEKNKEGKNKGEIYPYIPINITMPMRLGSQIHGGQEDQRNPFTEETLND